MKWVFLLVLLALLPVLIVILKEKPSRILFMGVLVGASPFLMGVLHLSVAPISWTYWPGPITGVSISLIDAFSVAIILNTRPVPTPIPLKIAFGMIAAALVISTFAATQVMPSLFYIFQLLATVLLYIAVYRASTMYSEFPGRILTGYAIGIAYEAYLTIVERMEGVTQAGGSFGHQNLLGMVTFFVVFPVFAMLLAGRRTTLALCVLACEAIIAFAGGSRSVIALLGLGIVLTLALSIWHRNTGRKAVTAIGAALVIAAAAPAMMLAIDRRPEAARASSLNERAAFEEAARLIIADHPLGVGANEYVVTANLGGYSDRAGVPWNYSERSAPVHSFYYLVTAEMGWLGLFGYVALLGGIILIGLRALRRATPSEHSELLVGLVAAAIVTTIQFRYEWVPMLLGIHYLVAINTGMLIAIARSVRRKGAPRPAAVYRPRPHAAEIGDPEPA